MLGGLGAFPLLLVAVYFALFLVVTFQIGRIIYNRHNLRSFQFGFLCLCAIFALLRGLFFLLMDVVSPAVFLVLYTFPVPIEFATFSLLVLFYAHVVHRTDWERRRRLLTGLYYGVNLVLLVGVSVIVALTFRHGRYDNPRWLQVVNSSFTSFVFLVISAILAYYGWRVSRMLRLSHVKLPFHPRSTNSQHVVGVTFCVLAIFTLRGIYDLITAFGLLAIDVNSSDDTKVFSVNHVVTFFFFLIGDVLPVAMVLVLFWRIPSTRGATIGDRLLQGSGIGQRRRNRRDRGGSFYGAAGGAGDPLLDDDGRGPGGAGWGTHYGGVGGSSGSDGDQAGGGGGAGGVGDGGDAGYNVQYSTPLNYPGNGTPPRGRDGSLPDGLGPVSRLFSDPSRYDTQGFGGDDPQQHGRQSPSGRGGMGGGHGGPGGAVATMMGVPPFLSGSPLYGTSFGELPSPVYSIVRPTPPAASRQADRPRDNSYSTMAASIDP